MFIFIRRFFSIVYLMSHRSVPLYLKALPIFALLYLLFPRDIIFDFRPGWGILDDLIVGTLLLGVFINKGWEHVQREEQRKNDAIDVSFEVLDRRENGHRRDRDPSDVPEDDRAPHQDLRSR